MFDTAQSPRGNVASLSAARCFARRFETCAEEVKSPSRPPTQDGAFEPKLSMNSRASQVKRGADSWLSWPNLGTAALLILTILLAVSILMEGQS
jgi:hypothetical protein